MRIVAISDTHQKHEGIDRRSLPPADLLIVAGDFCSYGNKAEAIQFLNWLNKLDQYPVKIVCAGNHDRCLERTTKNNPVSIIKTINDHCLYLEDKATKVCDYKIYASPWQPAFCNWAFNLPRRSWELGERWSKIPDNTEILITHCPPYGVQDFYCEHLGCELLWERVQELKHLKLHVFGHIHEGNGGVEIAFKYGGAMFQNVSICDGGYRPINLPTVIDLPDKIRQKRIRLLTP